MALKHLIILKAILVLSHQLWQTSQFHKLRELLYHLGLEESSDKSSQIIQPNTLQTPWRAPRVTPDVLCQISKVLDFENDPLSSTLFYAIL